MNRKYFYAVLLGAFAVVFAGLFVDVMEIDAAQYAEMCWEMLTTQSFLQVHNLGRDYLDKPPLLFWLGSLSFYFLGATNFAYKLPSALFALLAVFSVYKLAKLYYEENIARLSAVFLATSLSFFLMTNDVRTDTLLMGSVVFAIWQWAAYSENGQWKHLWAAGIGTASALLAKGPIGLIAIGAALLPQLVLKRKWQTFFRFRLLAVLPLIAALLLPMCVGLYQQFGTEGLKFYFWTQSFGRITGESEWNNHPDTFFLVHTTAWSILPWTLFFFWAWCKGWYDMVKMRLAPWCRQEFLSIYGFTLVLIALSLSKYQLPHYIYVVLPLATILAAVGFRELSAKYAATVLSVQTFLSFALLVVSAFLWYAFSLADYGALAVLCIAFSILMATLFFKHRILTVSIAGILFFSLYLNLFFFPALLRYQPEGDFGRYVTRHEKEQSTLLSYRFITDFSLVFYARQIPPPVAWQIDELRKAVAEGKATAYVVTTADGLADIDHAQMNYELLETRLLFKVARMNWTFLNPNTRAQTCTPIYLLKMKKTT